MSGPTFQPKTYYSVFGALIALMFLTVGISFLHMGEWHTAAGLTIAVLQGRIRHTILHAFAP
jgi:caa(3)-type oxidase subunit IV